MSLQYEKALQAWGAKRLASKYQIPGLMVAKGSVKVEMDFDEGYACGCGGNDPQCYCSLAESPTARVKITGIGSIYNDDKLHELSASIDHYEFDFVQVLSEIVDAGDGIITKDDKKRR